MYVKKKYEANEPKGFVTSINSCYNAYCEPTPDGILLEVTLIGRDEKDAATAAVNVAKPLTEEKISAALQYAALKGIHDYIGNNLVAPSKDGGASTKKVAVSPMAQVASFGCFVIFRGSVGAAYGYAVALSE